MPELPDVEGFRHVLERAVGHRVNHVDVIDDGVLRGTNGAALRRAVVDQMFGTPRRHGKWLVAPLRRPKQRHRKNEPSVVFHFGMSGGLVWSTGGEQHKHDRIVFDTAAGRLHYRDMRKLQGVRLMPDDAATAELVDAGYDAAELTLGQLRQTLEGSRRRLKPALMDQSVIAGLGNLMVDEILWRARIHPEEPAGDLPAERQRRLHRSIRGTVEKAIPTERVPGHTSWLTGHRDERDGECPRCGTKLRHTRSGGRRTVWCPRCQAR